MDYRNIIRNTIVRFRLRIITDEQAVQALQVHGFHKDPELEKEVLRILRDDRRAATLSQKRGEEILEETIQKLEDLLKKKERRARKKERRARMSRQKHKKQPDLKALS